MKKNLRFILVPVISALVLVSVALAVFLPALVPVRFSDPSCEIRVFSDESELRYLERQKLAIENGEVFYEQFPENIKLTSDEYTDYAVVYLRATIHVPMTFVSRFFKNVLEDAFIGEETVDDGIFLLKPSANAPNFLSPYEPVSKVGLTYIYIGIQGLSRDEIISYVKGIRLEAEIKSTLRSYRVPVDLSGAEVYFTENGE